MLEFLSNVDESCLYAKVPEEMIIDISGPKMKELDDNNHDMHVYNNYLSNTQQDDLMRKYILQERSMIPEAKCSNCSNKSCKSCQILQSHKSYAALMVYQRMFQDMKLVEVDGRTKIECSYTYREPIDEKFVPANSNREEALKATHSVIQRLIKIGKIQEFDQQMKEMEKMGTKEQLNGEEVENLEFQVHHFNKLNYTTSSTSNSTPLRILCDSTSEPKCNRLRLFQYK